MLCALLEPLNFELRLAGTVSEGLEFARSEEFDLYLVADDLAEGTGIELCRRLREFDEETPILFWSAFVRESDREEAMSAGANAFLKKPEDFYDLLMTVYQLIDQVRKPPVTQSHHAA